MSVPRVLLALSLSALLICGCSQFSKQPMAQTPQNGVPRIDPDYNADVEDWWTTHPFNPESAKYQPLIKSPEPVVTLEPGANLQEAIDNLPATGGTLKLTAGEYQRGFQIIGKSNIHVIGEGKVIVKGSFRYAGNQWARNYGPYDSAVSRRGKRIKEVWEAHKKPSMNYYVKGITFDGENDRVTAINLQRVYDVVIDDCVFENFRNPNSHHPGTVSGHEGLNNIWCRNSTFKGAGVYVCYLDGTHGSGFINCTIDINKYNGGFLFLTNDDFTEDINENGKTDREEERTAKYIVLYGNTYNGNNGGGAAFQTTGENILFTKNKINGSIKHLCGSDPRWTDSDPEICYHFYNYKIINNEVNTVTDSVLIERNLAMISCPKHIKYPPRMGKVTIRDNKFGAVGRALLQQVTLSHPEFHGTGSKVAEFDGPNVLKNNTVGGKLIAEGDIK